MDKPGVLAEITRLLSLHTISIDAMNQHEAIEGEQQTEVVILTHQTPEKTILQALAEIQLLPTVLAPVIKIRVETLA
jgi:homoserine dehydrogenase